MDIDWWSLFKEARIEAWHSVATIIKGFVNGLISMLTSGDLFQTIIAITLIVTIVYTSWRTILRLVSRLTRYDAWNF